jgi:hypothetical protein
LVAVLVCLCVAIIVGYLTGIDWKVGVGAFLGAAVSLAVNWLVLTLEEEPKDAPAQLVEAAHDDVRLAGYYRERQLITIRVLQDRQHGEVLVWHFRGKIVPARTLVKVERQTTRAPEGTEQLSSSYSIGGKQVAQELSIEHSTWDELEVRFKIKPDAKFPIEDNHSWSSPVLDYVVRIERSPKYVFTIGTIRPAGEILPLNPVESVNKKFVEYEGTGPAFSTQGLKLSFRPAT